MPIYEYVCSKCGHEWDAIQKFSERPLTNCPKCSKKAAKRKISASAFHLKGSGWYVTDYKKSGDGAKKDGGDSASEAPASESKGDSKPDTKADSKSEAKAESKSGSKEDTKAESRSESKSESRSGSRSDKNQSGKRKKSKAASA